MSRGCVRWAFQRRQSGHCPKALEATPGGDRHRDDERLIGSLIKVTGYETSYCAAPQLDEYSGEPQSSMTLSPVATVPGGGQFAVDRLGEEAPWSGMSAMSPKF
jgi:hypothetical protein